MLTEEKLDTIHARLEASPKGWTPMVLKLWKFRLPKTRIRFTHSTTRRSTNYYVSAVRYRQPSFSTNTITNSNNHNSSRCIISWTAPSLWVKTNATPGWLNQVRLSINRPGLLFHVTSVANKVCTKDNKVVTSATIKDNGSSGFEGHDAFARIHSRRTKKQYLMTDFNNSWRRIPESKQCLPQLYWVHSVRRVIFSEWL